MVILGNGALCSLFLVKSTKQFRNTKHYHALHYILRKITFLSTFFPFTLASLRSSASTLQAKRCCNRQDGSFVRRRDPSRWPACNATLSSSASMLGRHSSRWKAHRNGLFSVIRLCFFAAGARGIYGKSDLGSGLERSLKTRLLDLSY